MDQTAFDLASLHSAASGEDESFGSRAVDWVAKGIPAALGSGLVSMYNTDIALGNVLGADLDKADTGAALSAFDDNIANYYADHSQGADLGGFYLTSLAPGVMGIKALKMLQGGAAGLNAARITGSLKTTAAVEEAIAGQGAVARTLGYAANKEALYTSSALDKIRLSANEVFDAVTKDKIVAILAGTADQALQGAAFETAVLLTMNQSPILSTADEGYFTSIAANAESIWTAAKWQGLLGGGIGGLVTLGRLRAAKTAHDLEQARSVHSQRVGTSELDAQPGTVLAANFSYFDNLDKEFAQRRALGQLTDAEITNYERNRGNFSDELKVFMTTKLGGKENAALTEPLFKLMVESENPKETASLIFGSLKSFERISTAQEPFDSAAPKVFMGGDQLVARKATNIIKRGRVFPEVVDNPTDEQIVEMHALKNELGQPYELYRDSAGVFHVLENSPYAKTELAKEGITLTNFGLVVKVAGDGKGKVSETAFPVTGDLAQSSVALSKDGTAIEIDGSAMSLPTEFNPKKNAPIDSSSQFLLRNLQDLRILAGEDGALSIQHGDLPLLEAAAKKGFSAPVYYGPRVQAVTKTLVPATTKLETFLADVIRNHKAETLGQDILDTMSEADRTPAEVSQDFWSYTYHLLPEKTQKQFEGMYERLVGAKPKGVPFQDFVKNTEDWPFDAADLEGTERGFVALMEDVNRRLKQGIPEGLLEQTQSLKPTEAVTVTVPGSGGDISGDLQNVLHQVKIELRQDMIEAGHPFDRIARELNTTQDWAETGRGDGFLLKEDHTQPHYALLKYETGWMGDITIKHNMQGIVNLMDFVKLAKDQSEVVVASVLGKKFYGQLPNTKGTLWDVTTIPETASFVRATSGDVGSTLSFFQQSGKVAHSAVRDFAQDDFHFLQPSEFQLRAERASWAEANIVLQKFRSVDGGVYKWKEGEYINFVTQALYKKLKSAAEKGDQEAIQTLLEGDGVFQIKNASVRKYLLDNIELESKRAGLWNQIFQAMGTGRWFDPDRVHLPPLDTSKYSHVTFMKEKMDLGPGYLNDAGVVVAPTKADMEAKVDRIKAAYGDRFTFKTVENIRDYKIAKGEYETGPMLGASLTDQAMRAEGKLFEFQPRVDDEFINEFNNWHWRQNNNLVRAAIELKYAQEFAELRAMAKRFDESKFGPKNKVESTNKNPYMQYIKTALDVSNFDRYNSVWGKFNDATERFGSGMVDAWKNAFHRANEGEIDWEAANSMAEKYGLTPPYKGAIASIVQPAIPTSRAVEPAIAKVNGAISTLTLGLDFLQSVINIMSFPVMGLSEMKNILRQIKYDPQLLANLRDVTSVTVPESGGMKLPTAMKLLTNSMWRLAKDDGTLLQYYKDIEAIKLPRALGLEVYQATAMTPNAISSLENFSNFANTAVAKAAEYGRTISGSNKAETWVRFLAADMMKQITDIAKIPASDAPAYINSFVNRVHGNYLANQRPHLFQGVVGQAISLFQTYQFTLMQNMVRYVGQGDKTAAAMLLGMQNTIFGLQGNPAFYFLNEAIGKSNPDHVDIVSGSRMLVGEDVSNWMIYGLGANALHTALYNRGDLTPRYVTVVPTQVSDVPAVSIPYKAITSFVNAAGNIARGGNVKESILDGIAHFGANRPLVGLVQLSQGYRTTTQGNLLTAYNEINGWTVAAKLAGGEELNRGIAADAYYRNLAYKTFDIEQRKELGTAVKTTMYKGQNPSEDQVTKFMTEYTRIGGTPQGFNKWMNTQFKDSTQSQMNIMKAHVNSRAGRLQATMMGADTQDFWFNPPSSE